LRDDKIPHGTSSGRTYWKCECEPCKQAKRDYDAHVRRMQAYGTWEPHEDSEPLRVHIQDLLDQGWFLTQVAQKADVDRKTLYKILNGPGTPVRKTIADRIWPVWGPAPSPAQTNLMLPSWGAFRRVKALQAMGMTYRRIAQEAGVSVTTINELMSKNARPMMRAVNFYKIKETYDYFAEKTIDNPDVLSMNVARKGGWPPPMGWEDEHLDLSPEELELEVRKAAARMSEAERARCYRAHRDHGDMSILVKAGAKAHTNASYIEGVLS